MPSSSIDKPASAANKPLVLFAHGKESGPWGSKISQLADLARRQGLDVHSIDYQGMDDVQTRIEHLLAYQQKNALAGQPLVLVGSSMGGYVSAFACEALKPAALLLMAPALYMDGYPGEPEACPADTVVVHGWHDDIVPVDSSIRFARTRQATLHLVNDGHRLADSLDVIGLLFARQLQRVLAAA